MYEPTLAFDDSDETLEPSPPSEETVASLQVYHNDSITADIPLRAGVTRVGRAADKCDAVLHDNPTVSQHHVNIDIPLCPPHVTASALPSPFITASHALLDLDAITITNISTSNPACLSANSASPPRPSDPASWQLGVGASGRLLRHGMWLRLGSAVMRFMLHDYNEGVERAKRESDKERETDEAERISISDQTTQVYNPDADAAEEAQLHTAPPPVSSHLRSPDTAAPAGNDAGYNASGYSPVFADAEEESMDLMGTLPSNDTGEEGEEGAADAAAQPAADEQRTTEKRDAATAAATTAATDKTAGTEAMETEEAAEEARGSAILLSAGGDGSALSPIVLSMSPSQRADEAPGTVPAQPTDAERSTAAEADEDERSPGAPSPAPLAPGGPSPEGERESLSTSASAGARKATARTRRVPAADLQQREGETVEQRVIREREEQEERLREAAEEKRKREEEAFRQQEAERMREREERKRRAEEERRREAEELQLRRERERVERQQALKKEKEERAKQEEKEREEADRRRVEREAQERREEAEEEERQREVQRRIEEETKAAMARARAKKEEEDKRKREERQEEEERERQRQAAAEAEQARVAELERKRRAEATSQLEWRSKRKGRAAAAAAEAEKLSATSSDASRKEETEASPRQKLAKTASSAGSSSAKASKTGRRTRRQREEKEKKVEEEEPEQQQRAEAMQLDDAQQEAAEAVVNEEEEQPAKSARQADDRASSRPGRQRRRGHLQLPEEDRKEAAADATKRLTAMETAEADEQPEQQAESAKAQHAPAGDEEKAGGRSESTLLGVDALLDMSSPETSPAASATLSEQHRTRRSSTASARDSPPEAAATPKKRSARKRKAADSVVEEEAEQDDEQQQHVSAPTPVTKRTRTRSVEARRDDTSAADGQQLLSPATTRGARRGHSLPDSVGEPPARTATSREPAAPNLHSRRTASSTSSSLPSAAPILLLTGIAEPLQYADDVSALGGSIASDYSPAVTHLISDRVRRTDKFLSAYSTAQHVVSISWLTASMAAGAFLSPSSSPSFPLQDAEAEERYGFSLAAHRRNGHWLRGRRVWCSAHVQPGREAMQRIVEAGGGSLQDDVDGSRQEAVILIGCEEDREQCQQLASRGWTVHDRELLLTGVLRQKLEPELEQFIMLQPTHNVTAKGGKRGAGGGGRGRGRVRG